MRRAVAQLRINPRLGEEAIEVHGYACTIAGEPCIVHRRLVNRGRWPSQGGTQEPWVVSHIASGAAICVGLFNERRTDVIRRASERVEAHGGRPALLRAAALVTRVGAA